MFPGWRPRGASHPYPLSSSVWTCVDVESSRAGCRPPMRVGGTAYQRRPSGGGSVAGSLGDPGGGCAIRMGCIDCGLVPRPGGCRMIKRMACVCRVESISRGTECPRHGSATTHDAPGTAVRRADRPFCHQHGSRAVVRDPDHAEWDVDGERSDPSGDQRHAVSASYHGNADGHVHDVFGTQRRRVAGAEQRQRPCASGQHQRDAVPDRLRRVSNDVQHIVDLCTGNPWYVDHRVHRYRRQPDRGAQPRASCLSYGWQLLVGRHGHDRERDAAADDGRCDARRAHRGVQAPSHRWQHDRR